MEPFTLHCTTCRARLKVKDESVVGSILNCPRCGSMVHVVPPVDWQSTDSAVVAPATGTSNSATESSIVLNAGLPLSAIPAAESIAGVPPKLPATAMSEPAAASVAASGAEASGNGEAAVEPGAAARSGVSTWLRSDGLMWAGGLSAGVVVGAAAWFALTSLTSKPEAAPVVAEPVQVAQAAIPTGPEKSPPPQNAEPTASIPAVTSEPAESAPADLAAPAPSESAVDEQASLPEVAPNPAPQEAPAPESTIAATTETPTAAAGEAPPSLKLDPDDAPRATPAPDEAVVDAILGIDEPREPSAADTAEANADVDQPTGRPVADDETAITQEDVDSALAVRLSEVKFVGVPLAQFVEFIADTSALAISVDDAALAKVGKKRTMPLSVHLNDTTAQEALQAAIAPLGLHCELRGNRLFVTVPAAANDAAK